MLFDWTNVAIVGFLFAGLIMAVLSAVCAAADFHAPAPSPAVSNGRRQHAAMVVVEQMVRKAAAAERMLKQLEAMQVVAQQILDDEEYEADRPRDRGLISGSQAGFQIRKPVVSGSEKRR